MRKLFEFIRSIYVVVLFVALEVAAISYYAHSTHYTQARLLARSNQVAGGVHGFFAGIRRYFSLGHENRLLLGRVAQLEERLAQYEEAETNARLDSYMQDIGESKYRFVTASVVANTSTGRRTSSRSTADVRTAWSKRWPSSRPTARWPATSSTARNATPWRCRC